MVATTTPFTVTLPVEPPKKYSGCLVIFSNGKPHAVCGDPYGCSFYREEIRHLHGRAKPVVQCHYMYRDDWYVLLRDVGVREPYACSNEHALKTALGKFKVTDAD